MALKNHKDVNVDDEFKDYILDPELWLDKLPQPFRMIDEVLQQFLDKVWEVVESRDITRQQEKARVKIAKLSDCLAVAGSEGVKLVGTCNRGVVFVGSQSGLKVFDSPSSSNTNYLKIPDPHVFPVENVTCYDWSESPTNITIGQSKKVTFVAVVFANNVKVFAYAKRHLIHLTDISMEENEDSEIINCVVSPKWSHIAVANCVPESGCTLLLYQLPLTQWHSEIESYMEQVTSEVDNNANETKSQVSMASKTSKKFEDIVFSEATALHGLHSPLSVTPCTTVDPAIAMQTVLDNSKVASCIAPGDLHILNKTYLDNRRKAFVSKRADFVTEDKEPISFTHSKPHCHYLLYKNSCKQATPCYLTVWWEKHTQLFVFPILNSPTKSPPSPTKVLPQSSTIVVSAVNDDGRILAIGLEKGAVIVWDMKTDICINLVLAVDKPDLITCMKFFEGLEEFKLIVGSRQGRVVVVHTNSDAGKPAALSLGHRVSKQKEQYNELFKCSAHNIVSEVTDLRFGPDYLQSVVISVHANGSIVVWSSVEHEAFCRIILPPGFVPIGGQHCCAVGKGLLFIAGNSVSSRPGTQDDSQTSLFLFDLHTNPIFSPHRRTAHSSSQAHTTDLLAEKDDSESVSGMLGNIENYLSHYIRTRHALFEKDKEKWQKRWTELPLVISSRQTAQ